MTTIQVRIDKRTKKSAQKILRHLGMDLSTAIQIYLVQIIVQKGIPFQILTENGMTPEAEEELMRAWKDAKKQKKSYPSIRAAHRAILGK